MELKELEYIVAVAEAGSISRAAEGLYLAQSSLSQFLSRCEVELGVRLFLRTAGGARLTPSGEAYVRAARQMLRQYRRLKGELRELNRPGGGRIDFGISSFRGSYLLPRAVNTDLTAAFAASMARQGLELAFTYRSCVEPCPNVEYLSIGAESRFVDLVLAYPPDGCRSRAIRALERMIRQYIARVN